MKPKYSTFAIGDRVRFSGEWLRNTCQYTGPVGQLRGTVTGVRLYATCPPLITVEWDQPYFNERTTNVLATNLQSSST